MASSSNQPEARMSSESDSDYEPAEEEEEEAQSDGENLAQAYLERLLAGELDVDDEAEEEDGQEGASIPDCTTTQANLPLLRGRDGIWRHPGRDRGGTQQHR